MLIAWSLLLPEAPYRQIHGCLFPWKLSGCVSAAECELLIGNNHGACVHLCSSQQVFTCLWTTEKQLWIQCSEKGLWTVWIYDDHLKCGQTQLFIVQAGKSKRALIYLVISQQPLPSDMSCSCWWDWILGLMTLQLQGAQTLMKHPKYNGSPQLQTDQFVVISARTLQDYTSCRERLTLLVFLPV